MALCRWEKFPRLAADTTLNFKKKALEAMQLFIHRLAILRVIELP